MAQPVTVKEGWGAVAAAGSEGREGAAGPGAPFLGRFSAVHAVHLRRLISMVSTRNPWCFKTKMLSGVVSAPHGDEHATRLW